MAFASILKQLRDERNISQEELGRIVGVSRSAIAMYEAGEREPDFEIEEALADYFNVPLDCLRGRDLKSPIPFTITKNPANTILIAADVVIFPILGDVAAGFDRVAIEDWEGATVEIPRSYLHGRPESDYIVLRVCGDSMYPFYLDGDVVLVLRTPTLEYSGQVGLVRYEGEKATLKKVEYTPGEDWLRLVPLNPMHQPREITGADLEQCSILGVPKLLIRKFEE